MKKITKDLIKKGQKYHSIYEKGMSNHLPMALAAYDAIGASDESIKELYNIIIGKLVEVEDEKLIEIDNIKNHLGKKDSYLSLIKYFEVELEKYGREKVLKTYLKILSKAFGTNAFHSLIRLAYGLDLDDDSEIAIALADWVSSYTPLSVENEVVITKVNNLLEIANNNTIILNGNLIINRMVEVEEYLNEKNIKIPYGEINLDFIRKLVAKVYLTTKNFTILHAITSTHAFRIINEYLEDKEEGLREFWNCIVIAYISTGVKVEDLVEDGPKADWEEIFSMGLKSNNEHVIKLTHSAFEEYNYTKDDIYKSVAYVVNN